VQSYKIRAQIHGGTYWGVRLGEKKEKSRRTGAGVSEKRFESRSGMRRISIALRQNMEKEEVILMTRGEN
jgi:hypothetical protein